MKLETWDALIYLLAAGDAADWARVRMVLREARGAVLLEEALSGRCFYEVPIHPRQIVVIE